MGYFKTYGAGILQARDDENQVAAQSVKMGTSAVPMQR